MAILQKFSEHRFGKYLLATNSDLELYRSCFSIESSSWLALISAVEEIAITKAVTNYKLTF